MRPSRTTAATAATAWIAAALLAAAGPVLAETCYRASEGDGSLTFTFVVEGESYEGSFERFSVEYCMRGGRPGEGRIRTEVRLASVDTGNRDRDETLEGPEFFGVDAHPASTWRSTAIEAVEGGWRAQGRLALNGCERDQGIEFELEPAPGEGVDAMRMHGHGTVRRKAFDVGTGDFADEAFIRDRVGVRFDLRLRRRADGEAG